MYISIHLYIYLYIYIYTYIHIYLSIYILIYIQIICISTHLLSQQQERIWIIGQGAEGRESHAFIAESSRRGSWRTHKKTFVLTMPCWY